MHRCYSFVASSCAVTRRLVIFDVFLENPSSVCHVIFQQPLLSFEKKKKKEIKVLMFDEENWTI